MKKTFYSFKSLLFSVVLVGASLLSSNSNAQNYAALGTGVNGTTVRAVVEYGGNLIVGGDFTTAGGNPAAGIALWNGTTWSSLGSGVNGTVTSLIVFGNELYAAGTFTTAGGNPANRIAKWNGSAWSSLGLGLNGTAEIMAIHNNILYVGGSFTTAGGITVNRVASWSGSAWGSLGAGTNGTVNSLASYNNELYVGGAFTTVGGVPVNRIARWNGSNWNVVGSGIVTGSNVYDMKQHGSNLVVVGLFTNAGGATSENIAQWNGASWSSMGAGLTGGSARCMTSYLGDLYVGGLFTNSGANTVNRIARWTGSGFVALSTGGTNGDVRTLGTFDATLILGGAFTTSGSVSVGRIAKYGSIPVAPTLISPGNGSVGISPTPLMEWSALNNAFDYTLQLSSDPNFGSFIIDLSGIEDAEYQVPPSTLSGSTVYFWKANARNGMGTSPFSTIFFFTTTLTGIVNVSSEVPEKYNLYTNYPNPFNPSTKIKFDIPSANGSSNVRLVVFDAAGREVSTLINNTLNPGSYEFEFSAKNLTSGLYFYRLETDNFVDTKKMILVK
jgi:hypothetical protein